jgi:hypothetical protein
MGETSYNGWPASPDKAAIDIQPFGDRYGYPFPGGVRGGDVNTVLGYVAMQLHQRVEPAISGWLWGYTYRANVNNPSVLSCHASGTAFDFNAPNHPNSASGTFTNAQVGEIYAILSECRGAVQWGGDYTGTPDEMHFEIIVSAAALAPIAAGLPSSGAPVPPESEDDEMTMMIVQRADGVDYAHNPRRLITITDPGMYNLLLSNRWIDVPHGEAEPVNRDLIEWTAGQVLAGGGIADPLL